MNQSLYYGENPQGAWLMIEHSALHSSLQGIDALIDRRMEVTGKKKRITLVKCSQYTRPVVKCLQ